MSYNFLPKMPILLALLCTATMMTGCSDTRGLMENGTGTTFPDSPANGNEDENNSPANGNNLEAEPTNELSQNNPPLRDAILHEPPHVEIRYQTDKLSSQAAGYEWNYPEANGEWIGIAADSAHPLDFDYSASSLYLNDADNSAELQFSFPFPPERVVVTSWDGQFRQDAAEYADNSTQHEAEAVSGQPGEYRFSVPANQLRVFQIYAEWKEKNFYGGANYGFLAGPEGFFMDVKETGTENIVVIFQNHTEKAWIFGENYHLETWQDDQWKPTPYIMGINPAFNALAYVIKTGGIYEMPIDYRPFYGKLAPGKYRLTMSFMEEDADLPSETQREITAEFSI